MEYNNEDEFNVDINDEHIHCILEKEKNLRWFMLNKIVKKKPISTHFYFKYLFYGKEVFFKTSLWNIVYVKSKC